MSVSQKIDGEIIVIALRNLAREYILELENKILRMNKLRDSLEIRDMLGGLNLRTYIGNRFQTEIARILVSYRDNFNSSSSTPWRCRTCIVLSAGKDMRKISIEIRDIFAKLKNRDIRTKDYSVDKIAFFQAGFSVSAQHVPKDERLFQFRKQ